ncbi:sigma-E factor negative regulatory protein [Massilia violaceinigra]|uniref:sigma-E factor negative regulatory protein n=1 Tax=Massilia violaceinigra TaxID=2045208 RepID=UPI001FB1FCC8|nr:sigma-E factor negative regulatory protein [Massilia violaceinigra]
MDTPKTIREQISAFSDHELSPSTLPDEALRSAEGEHAWHAYHRIRDVIREQGAPHLSPGFADKLAARLAAEPLPGKRSVRASGEALARSAPAPVALAVAVAAGAAGPVTGIGAAAGDASGASAGAGAPPDPEARVVGEAADDGMDAPGASAAAAAEASIAAGAELVTIAVVKAAATVEPGEAGVVPLAADADAEARGALEASAGVADGAADPKAAAAIKPPISSVP